MAQRTIWIAAALAAAASLLPAQDKPSAGVPAGVPASAANGAVPADAAAKTRAQLTIGVVDLDKAFSLYPRAIAERERLQAMSKGFRDKVEAVTKVINQLREDLALLKEGSDEYEWKQYERSEALKRREALNNLLKIQFDREREKYLVTMYEDLEVAIAEVAKARGVQLVLRLSPTPELEDGQKDSQKQKLMNYEMRQLLYAGDEVDLTAAVIKFLQVPLEPRKPAAKPEAGAAKDAASRDTGSKDSGGKDSGSKDAAPKGGGL